MSRMYPKNLSDSLDDRLFEKPTAEYRGIPFWSWNCKVTKELIDRQLDCFKAMGFGGVDIHPRTGLDTEYLGEEYLRLVRYAAEKCREKGLACWLYDDDRFPSGAAGGLVTRERWTRGRYLWVTEKHREDAPGPEKSRTGRYILPEYAMSKEEMEKPESRTAGYYMGAFSYRLDRGYLTSYRWQESDTAIEAALEKGERVRFVYVRLLDKERWFEGQAYLDTMNPAAVKAFIEKTHEKYLESLGELFGEAVPAIFTDEPRMAPRKKRSFKLTFAESEEDIIVPYSEYFGRKMKESYGYDVFSRLPEYIWELPDGGISQFRYRYQDMLAECFVSAFLDPIGAWCRGHNILMTGHVLGEDSVLAQAWTLGDCMRCYRSMDIPGVDVLVDRRELLTVKQAASVAKQCAREGVLSELYGVTGWDCDFKTYKLQGDWQAALGVTVRVPHLAWMSMEGEAKRDWPASIFSQSPWYTEFSYIEDYFARLNIVLTRGKAITRVAVIHPVESAWLLMGPNDQTKGPLEELSGRLDELVRWLLLGCVDFDFISESLAVTQDIRVTKPEARLAAGPMEYEAVLVPGLRTIRATTLAMLRSFADAGGRVIFVGEVPSCVDATQSDEAKHLADRCERIPWSRTSVLDAVEVYRDVEIRRMDGGRSDNLIYQLRRDGRCGWLFLSHVYPKRNQISSEETYRVRLKGTWRLVRYDAVNGTQKPIPARMGGGYTEFVWRCHAQDSLLLRLEEAGSAGAETGAEDRRKKYETALSLRTADSFSRSEPNMLLLDYAEYQVDGGPVCSREEILRADNRIREALGFTPHGDEVEQPWALEEREDHLVKLVYTFKSEIAAKASLGIERPERCRIRLNGQEAAGETCGYYVDEAIRVVPLPDIRPGENRLSVEVRYNQKLSLENLYLLGDFDVELSGCEAVIVAPRQRLTIGDITRQGMPFYTGNLDYRFEFEIDEPGEYAVQVRRFAAPLLSVTLDGAELGRIAFAPHRLALGTLSPGRHELVIRLFGNRFNGFGHLHNANDAFEWIGPAAFRTEGDDWTDTYRVRENGLLSAVEIQRAE